MLYDFAHSYLTKGEGHSHNYRDRVWISRDQTLSYMTADEVEKPWIEEYGDTGIGKYKCSSKNTEMALYEKKKYQKQYSLWLHFAFDRYFRNL